MKYVLWFIYWLGISRSSRDTDRTPLCLFFSLSSLRSTIILNSYCLLSVALLLFKLMMLLLTSCHFSKDVTATLKARIDH